MSFLTLGCKRHLILHLWYMYHVHTDMRSCLLILTPWGDASHWHISCFWVFHLSHSPGFNITGTPWGGLFKFGTNFHLYSRTSWLDIQGSKVTVTSYLTNLRQHYIPGKHRGNSITSGTNVHLASLMSWWEHDSGQTCMCACIHHFIYFKDSRSMLMHKSNITIELWAAITTVCVLWVCITVY